MQCLTTTVTCLPSVLLMLSLLAAGINAFTDFHGMSGPHQRVVLSDGTIHLSHDVHHVFEARGTYFSAKYVARHEAKWNFVRLDLLESELATKLKCGTQEATTDLVIRHPSDALLQSLSAVSSNVVITAAPKFHCRMKPIFRHLSSYRVDGDRVILKTVPAAYETIFRDLKVSISTNHTFGVVNKPAQDDARSQQKQNVEKPLALQPSTHKFQQQNIFDRIKNAVSRTFDDGVNDVKKAASDVKNAVVETGRTIDDVVHGDFDIDAAYPMNPTVSYNADQSVPIISNQLVSVQFNAGASLVVSPSINFELDIQGWHLQNVEVFFEGDAQFSMSVLFKATAEKKVKGGKDPLDTINFDPITFMLGDIPIVIHPSIPINLDVVLNIDGEIEIGATLSAQASIRLGVGYSPSTGHQLIHSIPTPTFTHAITPATYKFDAGITVTLQPVFSVSIDNILSGNIAFSIGGEALLQSNPTCLFDLTVTAQGLITASADLGISIDGHTITQIPLASSTLWSQTYPIASYCKANPDKSDFSGSTGHHRKFLEQNASSSSGIVPTAIPPAAGFPDRDHCGKKHKWVRDTVLRKLGAGNIGKVWTGTTVSCGVTDLIYSLKFSVGEANSSLALVTVTKVRPPGVPVGRGFATATAQLLYQSPTLPEVGKIQTYSLINASDIYMATTNATEVGFEVPISFLLLFSPTNIRHARLDSPLTCGPVGLRALEVNNDESAFTTLSSAYDGTGASASTDDAQSSSNTVWMAATASCGALAAVAIIVAAVVSLRSRRRSGGSRRASTAGDDDSKMMDNLTAPIAAEGINTVEDRSA